MFEVSTGFQAIINSYFVNGYAILPTAFSFTTWSICLKLFQWLIDKSMRGCSTIAS